MARSFLQAVSSSEEIAPPLRVVQMEGLVNLEPTLVFLFIFRFGSYSKRRSFLFREQELEF